MEDPTECAIREYGSRSTWKRGSVERQRTVAVADPLRSGAEEVLQDFEDPKGQESSKDSGSHRPISVPDYRNTSPAGSWEVYHPSVGP